MLHPDKWRETTDPFSLPFHHFQLMDVLGYPHAGNDVFQVRGIHAGRTVEAYIKVARHQEANLQRETMMLQALRLPQLPRLLDWDEDFRWLVTEALPGQRLSVLVGDNTDRSSERYMAAYGEALARLHGQQGEFPEGPHRRFMDVMDESRSVRLGLKDVRAWLLANQPTVGAPCFCHGDFHYANLLWEDGKLSGILDLELSGMSQREFDMAWALIRRPGQKFMNTDEEVRLFLEGYRKIHDFDPASLRWYMVNAYAWFAGIGAEDEAYSVWIRQWIDESIGKVP